MTISIEKCIKCGKPTDWEASLGPEAMCPACWDGETISTDAKSAAIAERGIFTGEDFAHTMAALMADVLAGRISPDVAKAACMAGTNLLKVVEMQYRLTNNRTMEMKDNAQLLIMAPRDPE